MSGYSPDELTPVHGPYTDFVAPRFSCFALLSAIDHRRRTGEGQMIDMSQYEAALNFLSPALTDYFATGRVAEPAGNRSARYAPHGAYQCRDDAAGERWVALAVAGDEQWRDLLRVLGDDAGVSMFPGHADRLERRDEVDQYVGALVAGRDAAELTAALQQAGISAYPVQNCADLREDENLRAWGFFRDLDQSKACPMPYDGFAYRLDRTPGRQSAAPNIGEHTDEVLSGLLGLSAAEIGRASRREDSLLKPRGGRVVVREQARHVQQVTSHSYLQPGFGRRGNPGQPPLTCGSEDVVRDYQPYVLVAAQWAPCHRDLLENLHVQVVNLDNGRPVVRSRVSHYPANAGGQFPVTLYGAELAQQMVGHALLHGGPVRRLIGDQREGVLVAAHRDRQHDVFLGGKIPVQRGERDLRALSQLLHLQHVLPAPGEHGCGRLQDALVAPVLC